MKKYLKITNIGTMSRKFLELIGATDKRSRMDDSSTIGNKGSGAKFAIVPALRLGYEVAVSSSDDNGDFLLVYEKEKVQLTKTQEIEQIVFNYINGLRFPSQLTLDALRDWDQPVGEDNKKIFKAFREYICNAWDADKEFTTEIVDEITQAIPGTTSAYITLTEDIEKILKNSSQYIKFMSSEKPIFSHSSYGNIYKKSEEGVTRLFCQGVLVDCKKSKYYSSIFDYSLDNKWLLSEERVIKDYNEYVSQVGSLLTNISDLNLVINLLNGLISEKAELEGDALKKIEYIPSNTKKMYLLAWEATQGEKAIIAIGSNQADNDARNRGYVVVEGVPYYLSEFLKKCGVKTSKDFATIIRKNDEEKKFIIISPNIEQKKMYDKAYRIFLNYFPQARLIPVEFFSSEHWSLKDVLGHCGLEERKFKEIWISNNALVSVNQILKILVHEGRHCITEAGDYDRGFTQYADDQLVDMMLKGSPSGSITTWKAQLVSKRGILLPSRFIGFDASIVILGKEVSITLSKVGQTEYSLTSSIKSDIISQKYVKQRTVSNFDETNFGAVYIPEVILAKLPKQLSFQIIDNKMAS